MLFRHTLSRRDALLVIMGASVMHLCGLLLPPHILDQSIFIDTQYHAAPIPPLPPADLLHQQHLDIAPSIITATAVITETLTESNTVTSQSISTPSSTAVPSLSLEQDLPSTSVTYHAPGWTLFRNLYMSNGTLYILSSDQSMFPEIRMMTSTGLPADNTPGNLEAREPTAANMDFITPEEAHRRWGGHLLRGEKHRVLSVEGNTMLFNDPGSQFLNHYYHFVAELWFGAWAFWHSAWSKPSSSPSSSFSLSHPSPPPIHRAIFTHAAPHQWRDNPGFNAYFLRAAFPSLTVEVQQDWEDRIAVTADTKLQDRAWHFPTVLLADRSAAFRGQVCGSHTQRTAAEAWEFMNQNHKLMGSSVGGWWEPIREAVWRFAGANVDVGVGLDNVDVGQRGAALAQTDANELALSMPEKIVITYISRQGVSRRKLLEDDHVALVAALQDLVARKGSLWELHVLHAERMTKDEQIQAAAKTTIMLGVHGNGLSHLIFMKPSRASAVVEIFYPGGFAHDYEWTSRALGMDHYSVWNDKYNTYPDVPGVGYPDGFQGNSIPVDGLAVARLIEEHVDRKSKQR